MKLDRRRLTAGLAGLALAGPSAVLADKLPQPDPVLWDPPVTPLVEGRAKGPNGEVYYRLYGRPGALAPVIGLHGGPAGQHVYMRPYAALARLTGRQVVLYDQSGCGLSAAPPDLSLYTVERYVAELEALRAALGFPKVILLGHSWGGMLAQAYALAHPDRVGGLVLAGTSAAWRGFQDAADRWLAELGPQAVATVKAAESSGRYDTPEYQALLGRYYQLHLCRLDPWPQWFAEAGEAIGRNPVYVHLNGPSEFQFNGALRGLDFTGRLREIRAPALVTCGEFDEAPAAVSRVLMKAPGARELRAFRGLSHMTHIEDPELVVGATAAFLRTIA